MVITSPKLEEIRKLFMINSLSFLLSSELFCLPLGTLAVTVVSLNLIFVSSVSCLL